jgi:hypothetical protein
MVLRPALDAHRSNEAGGVDEVAKIRKELLSITYDGLWKLRFDDKGDEIFNFDICAEPGGVRAPTIGFRCLKYFPHPPRMRASALRGALTSG